MELQPKNLASNDRKIDISSKCQEYSIHCWSLASGAKNWEIFWAENWSLWALLTDTPLKILIILISDYKEYPLGHSNWSLHFFSQVRRKNRQHRELDNLKRWKDLLENFIKSCWKLKTWKHLVEKFKRSCYDIKIIGRNSTEFFFWTDF